MSINRVEIPVRFNEMDEMGIVHNSVYFVWFEIARFQFARAALKISYDEMKKKGILLPVIHSECRYIKPAVYPDTVVVECFLEKSEKAVITLYYEITRKLTGEKIARGKTVNAFTRMDGSLCLTVPDFIGDAIRKMGDSSDYLWDR